VWRHGYSGFLLATYGIDCGTPTLVVHGAKDVVVMPINAFLLAQHLPNAQLIMYPDASHGAQSQHADVFLEHVRLFLDQ
jgi:pimeloyl-ACP methyl ester carboxylesterase